MLVIVIEPIDGNAVRIPPLLQPISQELLNRQCADLQQLAHEHFRNYLSPFIRKEHLQLTNLKEVLVPDYPYFVYFNPAEYISTIVCTVKKFNAEAALKRSYLIKNTIVLVTKTGDRWSERIIKKTQIEKVNKKLQETSQIFIRAKQIKLRTDQQQRQSDGEPTQRRWDTLLAEKWSKWQDQNESIYILCVKDEKKEEQPAKKK